MRLLLLVLLAAALAPQFTAGAQRWRNVPLPDGPSSASPRIMDIAMDGSTVWLSTERDGLLAYDGTLPWVLHMVDDPEDSLDCGGLRSNAWHNTILVDSAGDKWTSKDGTQTVDRLSDARTFREPCDDSWTYYSQPDQLNSTRVFSMAEDENGNKWFGIRDENSTESSMIELLIENGPGTADDDWLAFGGSFDPAIFSAGDIRGLEMDGQGRLWIVYARAGVDVWGFGDYHSFDDDTIAHYGAVDGLPSDAVHVVHAGDDGRVWVGADNGIAVFDPSSETWTSIDGLPSDRVNDIDSDAQGHVWAGTDDGVVMLYRTGEIVKNYTAADDGLHDDEISLIAVDQLGGNVWAVSEDLGTGETFLNVLESGFGPEPRVFAYPNPWKEREAPERNVDIMGVPDGSTVVIFDITGQRVRELVATREPYLWDSLDSNLNEVASGVYIVRAVTPSGQHLFTKVAIIR